MKLRGSLAIVLVLFMSCAVAPVFGQKKAPARVNDLNVDVSNLEEGIPLCVEDANVLPKGHTEAQGIINWGNADQNNWLEYHVQVAAGLGSNWQGTAGVVFKDNNLDSTGDGDIFVKLMHQFRNTEKDSALYGVRVNFPTGQDYARMDNTFPPFHFVVNERKDRVDFGLMGVYTRILNDKDKRERLHLEARETFVRSAPVGASSTQLFLGVGFDKLVREDTLAMASICWVEKASTCNHASSVLQFGLRHKENERFLLGAGLKIGLDWAAANWGLTWGAQYGF